jgi:hypothetical protein
VSLKITVHQRNNCSKHRRRTWRSKLHKKDERKNVLENRNKSESEWMRIRVRVRMCVYVFKSWMYPSTCSNSPEIAIKYAWPFAETSGNPLNKQKYVQINIFIG